MCTQHDEFRMRVKAGQKAPKGKIRVAGFKPTTDRNFVLGDFDTQEEAFRRADDKNKKRRDWTCTVYYVYNDEGEFIRGDEVSGMGTGPLPGVGP